MFYCSALVLQPTWRKIVCCVFVSPPFSIATLQHNRAKMNVKGVATYVSILALAVKFPNVLRANTITNSQSVTSTIFWELFNLMFFVFANTATISTKLMITDRASKTYISFSLLSLPAQTTLYGMIWAITIIWNVITIRFRVMMVLVATEKGIIFLIMLFISFLEKPLLFNGV